MPLGISVMGRRRKVTTRKPGDLPSAVVTREDVGRGVQALASPELLSAPWWDLVRCDVPLTSYRGLNHVFHHPSRSAAAQLLARFKFPGTCSLVADYCCKSAAIRLSKRAPDHSSRGAPRQKQDPTEARPRSA